MRVVALASALFVVAGAPLGAQAYQPADSHERAVMELIEVMELEATNAQSAALMLDAMVQQNPMLAQFKDVFEEFFAEHMRWDAMLPDYVRMYRDAYDDAEIRELLAFYRTPVGQKTVRLMPVLMQQGAEVGQKLVAPHLPELERRLTERLMGGEGGEGRP